MRTAKFIVKIVSRVPEPVAELLVVLQPKKSAKAEPRI